MTVHSGYNHINCNVKAVDGLKWERNLIIFAFQSAINVYETQLYRLDFHQALEFLQTQIFYK